MENKSIARSKSDRAPERDEKRHEGGKNDGVASADPGVTPGKKDGDATFPIKKDK